MLVAFAESLVLSTFVSMITVCESSSPREFVRICTSPWPRILLLARKISKFEGKRSRPLD